MDGADYVMAEKKIENRGWNYICLTEQKEVTRDGSIVLKRLRNSWNDSDSGVRRHRADAVQKHRHPGKGTGGSL